MNLRQEKRGRRGSSSNSAAAASQTKPGSNLAVIIFYQSYLKIPLMYGHESSTPLWVCTHPKIAFRFLGLGNSKKKAAFPLLVA